MTFENIKQLPEQYRVGDVNIDKQHAVIIHILEKCIKRRKSVTAEIDIDEILKELADYPKTHFAFEEKLLKKFNYPQLQEHVLQHKNFIENINEVILSTDQEAKGNKIALLLKDWFLNHINSMDKEAIARE